MTNTDRLAPITSNLAEKTDAEIIAILERLEVADNTEANRAIKACAMDIIIGRNNLWAAMDEAFYENDEFDGTAFDALLIVMKPRG